jgi:hypothetical protein
MRSRAFHEIERMTDGDVVISRVMVPAFSR